MKINGENSGRGQRELAKAGTCHARASARAWGEKGGEGGMNCERGAGGGTASASMRRERERAARELAAAGGQPRSLPPFPFTLYRW